MLHLLLLCTVYFRDEWAFVKSRLRGQRKIKLLQIGYYIKFVVGVTFIYSLDLLSEISINLAKLILIIKNMAQKLCKTSNILIVTNKIIPNPRNRLLIILPNTLFFYNNFSHYHIPTEYAQKIMNELIT